MLRDNSVNLPLSASLGQVEGGGDRVFTQCLGEKRQGSLEGERGRGDRVVTQRLGDKGQVFTT